jgi:uncharacterized alpha-E superfamily protein
MGVMGSVPPPPTVEVTRSDVLTSLAVDRANPSSIAYAVQASRENARRAREIVSTELWETLNTTNSRMPRRLHNEKVHEFFQWVRERSALAVGITDSSTSRDEAWQFLTLGRAIERTDMTARLLATRADRGIRSVVDDDPALLRRLRGVSTHLPRDAERVQRS